MNFLLWVSWSLISLMICHALRKKSPSASLPYIVQRERQSRWCCEERRRGRPREP